MAKNVERWGEVVELHEASSNPIVYHFRPTSYVKIAPERLQEWEEYFAEHVELVPDASRAASFIKGRSATLSGSHDAWDDADYV